MKQLAISVGGMTCAACQAHVQSGLLLVPGVETASVNLITKSASVVFDSAKVKPEALGELLEVMLPMVADALGWTLNGESVPPLFEQAVRGFLQGPFALPDPVRVRALWTQVQAGSIVGKPISRPPLKGKRKAGSADPA